MTTHRVPCADLLAADAVLLDGVAWKVEDVRFPDLSPGDVTVTRTVDGLNWTAHLAWAGPEVVTVWR